MDCSHPGNPILQKEHRVSRESWPEMPTRTSYICGKGACATDTEIHHSNASQSMRATGGEVCLPETSRLHANILLHLLANLHSQKLPNTDSLYFGGSIDLGFWHSSCTSNWVLSLLFESSVGSSFKLLKDEVFHNHLMFCLWNIISKKQLHYSLDSQVPLVPP